MSLSQFKEFSFKKLGGYELTFIFLKSDQGIVSDQVKERIKHLSPEQIKEYPGKFYQWIIDLMDPEKKKLLN